ncbi:hypothetical protein BURPSS13_T0338 [Burkholderia pseudomallei S13]|uniref:Uncharacterized protein n=1 Tax=Burkholderia mallei (strain NCTC 10229) TaxID=412022 RepID=A2RXL4_BURM9|nr:hypothetical protein BMA10229_0617 [Burkholderia mallei NCTC 10229]EDK55503.1 hypothetical protein BMAFMH_E0566 [Burkholderia mallei FMH]EDK61434.1 hypothetical protein BMAJHU_I0471 [Burkholderia mallei JHU]EDS82227.1 hypothetical protein BURPSS13_T0338 [Burkholderia pseudomallei S13]
MRFAAFAANGVRLAAHAIPASVDIEPHVCPLSPIAGDPRCPGRCAIQRPGIHTDRPPGQRQ